MDHVGHFRIQPSWYNIWRIGTNLDQTSFQSTAAASRRIVATVAAAGPTGKTYLMEAEAVGKEQKMGVAAVAAGCTDRSTSCCCCYRLRIVAAVGRDRGSLLHVAT